MLLLMLLLSGSALRLKAVVAPCFCMYVPQAQQHLHMDHLGYSLYCRHMQHHNGVAAQRHCHLTPVLNAVLHCSCSRLPPRRSSHCCSGKNIRSLAVDRAPSGSLSCG